MGGDIVKLTYTAGEGKYLVSCSIIPCGKDLSVTIIGGTHPHIGAVAIGLPRPSLTDPNQTSTSTSVFCVTGHKDDEVAKHAADKIAAVFNCTVVVSVGIHVDQATHEDVKRLWQNAMIIINDIT